MQALTLELAILIANFATLIAAVAQFIPAPSTAQLTKPSTHHVPKNNCNVSTTLLPEDILDTWLTGNQSHENPPYTAFTTDTPLNCAFGTDTPFLPAPPANGSSGVDINGRGRGLTWYYKDDDYSTVGVRCVDKELLDRSFPLNTGAGGEEGRKAIAKQRAKYTACCWDSLGDVLFTGEPLARDPNSPWHNVDGIVWTACKKRH